MVAAEQALSIASSEQSDLVIDQTECGGHFLHLALQQYGNNNIDWLDLNR